MNKSEPPTVDDVARYMIEVIRQKPHGALLVDVAAAAVAHFGSAVLHESGMIYLDRRNGTVRFSGRHFLRLRPIKREIYYWFRRSTPPRLFR